MRYKKLTPQAKEVALRQVTSLVEPIQQRIEQASNQMNTLPHDSDSYVDAYYELLGAQNELKVLVGKKMATSVMKGNFIHECLFECSSNFTAQGELK